MIVTDHSKPLPPEAVLPRPDAILFDWDGTLVDSFDMIRQGYQCLIDRFGGEMPDDVQIGAYMRRSARDLFPALFGDHAAEAARIFSAFVRDNHLACLAEIEGAAAFLSLLKSKNILSGVVSNRNHEWLVAEVPHIGWADHFGAVVGAGKAARDKPFPDPLLLARDQLGLTEKSCIWYVGDSETDMEAALAAGMVPVFVTHGLRTLDDCARIGIYPHVIDMLNPTDAL